MGKKEFRAACKLICLAQAASDSGKGCTTYGHNAQKADREGYGIKDTYILQALAESKNSELITAFKEWHGELGMVVIYFEICGYGQVSFHSFMDFNKIPCPVARKEQGWNGIIGGSSKTTMLLSNKLNLQVW